MKLTNQREIFRAIHTLLKKSDFEATVAKLLGSSGEGFVINKEFNLISLGNNFKISLVSTLETRLLTALIRLEKLANLGARNRSEQLEVNKDIEFLRKFISRNTK
jgi:hypothetical protein